MGWISKAWAATKTIVKKTVKAVASGVKKVASTIKDAVTNPQKAWNGLTGRSTFNEAETLLNEITERYDKAKFKYKKNMNKLNNELEIRINKINYHKTDIFDIHFKRFTLLGNKLHNINIQGRSFLEYFDDNITQLKKMQGVQNKEKLYTIDFNNLKLSEITFGVLTLGFFTRKKAKETLQKVKDEEQRINEEIVKMDSQVSKVKVTLESIKNVAQYFEVLVQNYSKLLDRFDYGISTQIQRQILRGYKLENGKLDFKLMPIIHIEEFQALFNLSIILKQMSVMGYLNENGLEDNDIKSVNNIWHQIQESELISA